MKLKTPTKWPLFKSLVCSAALATALCAPSSAIGKSNTLPPADAWYVEIIPERQEFEAQFRQLIRNKDFDKLDEIVSRSRTEQSRWSNGYSHLRDAYRILADEISRGPELNEQRHLNARSFAAAWAEHNPQSVAAIITQAMATQDHAWSIRGSDFANQTERERLEKFAQLTDQAAEGLLASKSLASIDPQWYHLAITLAGALGEDRMTLQDLFMEGIDRHPYYEPIYYAKLNMSLPQWGGSVEEILNIVGNVRSQTREKFGKIILAKIYSNITDHVRNYNQIIPWTDMKEAYIEFANRYPTILFANEFANAACEAGDYETSRELFQTVILNHPQLPKNAGWKSEKLFAICLTNSLLPPVKGVLQ